MTDANEAAGPATVPAPAYDPERLYLVELNCPVECPKGSGKMLYPGKGRRNMVRGDQVAALGQAVTHAVAV